MHTEIVPGDALRIQVMPKGGGCENMSRFTIMLPNAGKDGITDFVLQTVEESGGNPCPPIIVGLGVGGTAEHAMFMAKHALTRPVGDPNPDPEQTEFEAELLEKVNALGLGRSGGGRHSDGSRRAHGDAPHAHRLAAGRGEPPVPLGASERSTTVMSDIRIVRATELSEATAQTPGMHRAAAVDAASCQSERLWVGVVTVDPATSTGAHHHGECDSVVCVTAGRITVRWGDRLQHRGEAGPGDFIYIPANLVHQEINESDSLAVASIVIRSGDNVVVNVVLDQELDKTERGG